MSFGYSLGDIIGVTQLALKVVDNCRKACGEHAQLTHDVQSLHAVLRHLEQAATAPDSLLNRKDDSRNEGLKLSVEGCRKVLSILDGILEKYNALSEDQRAGKRLWSKIQFGNGEMQDLHELRIKISTYTSAITLHLNLVSIGSQGRVERQITDTLPEMRQSLDWITAKLSTSNEGSILTSYTGDDKAVWKELRRELVIEGFSSDHIREHKRIIMAYIKELGDRGALDDMLSAQASASIEALDQAISVSSSVAATKRMFREQPMSKEEENEEEEEEEDLRPFEEGDLPLREPGTERNFRREQSPQVSIRFITKETETSSSTRSSISGDNDQDSVSLTRDSNSESSNRLEASSELERNPCFCFQCEKSLGLSKTGKKPLKFLGNSFHPKHSIFANELCCGHRWCSDCLRELFIQSIYTPSLMPPKCCNIEIDSLRMTKLFIRDDIQPHRCLVPSFHPLWEKKRGEFTARNPAYCPNSLCGAWIDNSSSRRIRGAVDFSRPDHVLTCGECGRKLCARCFSTTHPGRACVSRERQEQNAVIGQKVNMRVNARGISDIIGVPVDEIVKGTLGRDLKYTYLVSTAAKAYRLFKWLKWDEEYDPLERMLYLG